MGREEAKRRRRRRGVCAADREKSRDNMVKMHLTMERERTGERKAKREDDERRLVQKRVKGKKRMHVCRCFVQTISEEQQRKKRSATIDCSRKRRRRYIERGHDVYREEELLSQQAQSGARKKETNEFGRPKTGRGVHTLEFGKQILSISEKV